MIKIAITGNIASGKSEAESYLVQKGFKIVDADKLAHQVLLESKNEIVEVFKDYDILDDNNEICRTKLGQIVFNNKSKKQCLESIVHEKVIYKIKNFFIQNANEKIIFVSIPLLFEAGMQELFDKIIFISADENIRLKRLMQRNNYSEEYAIKRLKSQDIEKEKIKKSDFIIFNNSDLNILKNQIDIILNIINQ